MSQNKAVYKVEVLRNQRGSTMIVAVIILAIFGILQMALLQNESAQFNLIEVNRAKKNYLRALEATRTKLANADLCTEAFLGKNMTFDIDGNILKAVALPTELDQSIPNQAWSMGTLIVMDPMVTAQRERYNNNVVLVDMTISERVYPNLRAHMQFRPMVLPIYFAYDATGKIEKCFATQMMCATGNTCTDYQKITMEDIVCHSTNGSNYVYDARTKHCVIKADLQVAGSPGG